MESRFWSQIDKMAVLSESLDVYLRVENLVWKKKINEKMLIFVFE